jgi:flagellar basal body rod protein FlgG
VSIDVNSIAIQGLDRAQQVVERSAKRLANPEAVDTVTLATAAVEMKEAVSVYEANLRVIEATDEMTRRTLDLLA